MNQLMHVFAFDTYNDMINNTELHTNCLAITLGKDEPGDGGGDMYYLLENQKMNKYTNVGEPLRNDNMFKAAKINLGFELSSKTAAEDAKYSVRSLISSNITTYENKISELSQTIKDLNQYLVEANIKLEETCKSDINILNNTIDSLLIRINTLENKLNNTSTENTTEGTTEDDSSTTSSEESSTTNNDTTESTSVENETHEDSTETPSEESTDKKKKGKN
jgi:hypothetical protein